MMQELFIKYADIINEYFENEAKKLRELIDKILFKLKFDVDKEEFYSLGSEIFVRILPGYDDTKDFDAFLYSCLINKFKTEMTRRNRQKRKIVLDVVDIDENGKRVIVKKSFPVLYLDAPIHDDEENSKTLGDVVAETKRTTDYDIEKTFFEDDGEKYSENMLLYISKLSPLQREVVKLIVAGYSHNEIKEILHISERQYSDCMLSIRSYKNISILF